MKEYMMLFLYTMAGCFVLCLVISIKNLTKSGKCFYVLKKSFKYELYGSLHMKYLQ